MFMYVFVCWSLDFSSGDEALGEDNEDGVGRVGSDGRGR